MRNSETFLTRLATTVILNRQKRRLDKYLDHDSDNCDFASFNSESKIAVLNILRISFLNLSISELLVNTTQDVFKSK